MIELELKGGYKDIEKFQKIYNDLLDPCDKWGAMIMQDRAIEVYSSNSNVLQMVYRKGTRDYIFPKQGLEVDIAREIRTTSPDDDESRILRIERQTFGFDEGRMYDRMRIDYSDVECPIMKVHIERGCLPRPVEKVLKETFGQTSLVTFAQKTLKTLPRTSAT